MFMLKTRQEVQNRLRDRARKALEIIFLIAGYDLLAIVSGWLAFVPSDVHSIARHVHYPRLVSAPPPNQGLYSCASAFNLCLSVSNSHQSRTKSSKNNIWY
jgi:hypothetical protein